MKAGSRCSALWREAKGRLFSVSEIVGSIKNRWLSLFSSALPLVSSTCKTSPSKVSSLEELSYYHLSMEEGEVNDNTIKLTRAVNSDLTPTV